MSQAHKSPDYQGFAALNPQGSDSIFPSAESMGLTVEKSVDDNTSQENQDALQSLFYSFLKGEVSAEDLVALRDKYTLQKHETLETDSRQPVLPGIMMDAPRSVERIKAQSNVDIHTNLQESEDEKAPSTKDAERLPVEIDTTHKKDSLFPGEQDETPWFEPFSKKTVLDFVESLALQNQTEIDDERYLKARNRDRGAHISRSSWEPVKSLGRTLSSVPLELLKAPLKGIDALLPDSLQTTPKLEMIDALRTDKQRRMAEVEEGYQYRLQIIESGYSAIAEYVASMSEEEFNAIDWTGSTATLINFVDECVTDESSPHAVAVGNVKEKRKAELEEEYRKTLREIEEDDSAEFVAEGIRNSSWLLQSLRPPSASISPESLQAEGRNSQTYFDTTHEVDVDLSIFDESEGEKNLREEKEQLRVYIDKLQSDAENHAQKLLDKAQKPGLFARAGKAFSGLINQLKPVNLVQIETLKKQKREAYAYAQTKADIDLQVLSMGYAAVSEYVSSEYGCLLERFNTSNNDECQKLVDRLLTDVNCQGFYAVQKIKDRLIQERARTAYEEEQRILTTDSSDDIKELAEGSRLIRMRDAIRSAIGLPIDYSEEQPLLQQIETQPTLMISDNRDVNSESHPVLKDDNQRLGHVKPSDLKGRKGGTPPTSNTTIKRRSRLWYAVPAMLAGAAAFFVKGHNATEDVDYFVNQQNISQKTDVTPSAALKQKVDTTKVLPKQLSPAPVKTVKENPVTQVPKKPQSVAKKSITTTPTVPPAVKAKSSIRSQKPETLINPESPKKSVEPKNSSTEIAEQQDKLHQSLTEAEKQTKMREAFALVSGYERRINNFLENAKPYIKTIASNPYLNPQISGLPTKMREELDKLQKVDSAEEADRILSTLRNFSSLISAEEYKLRDLDIGSADFPLQIARERVKEAQKLSSSTSFTITHYPQNANGTVAPKIYNVDLLQIQVKLDALNAKIAPSASFKVSPSEANLAKQDANYWQGYMEFVLWNLKYNKGAIGNSVN